MGNVTGYLGESFQDVLFVIDRGEDDIGIEDRPVFAFAQPDAFIAAIFQCLFQVLKGLAQPVVFFGVEEGNGLADDLGLGVAFDLLGAFIPAHDPALGVDEKNGVVLNVPDKEAESLFQLTPLSLGRLAASEIIQQQEEKGEKQQQQDAQAEGQGNGLAGTEERRQDQHETTRGEAGEYYNKCTPGNDHGKG